MTELLSLITSWLSLNIAVDISLGLNRQQSTVLHNNYAIQRRIYAARGRENWMSTTVKANFTL